MKSRRAKISPLLSRTPSPDPKEDEQRKLEFETEFHQALIEAHGRPCYPIELAPQIYKSPGLYKNILFLWRRGLSDDCSPISCQLNRWNLFCQFQQRNREIFVPQARFLKFQQKGHWTSAKTWAGRQREATWDKQTNLDHWMKYQDYELRRYGSLEEDYKKAQKKVVELRKELANAGLCAYE